MGSPELFRLERLADDHERLTAGERVSGPAAATYAHRITEAHRTFAGRVLTNTSHAHDMLANPLLQIYPGRAMTCVFDQAKALCQIRGAQGDVRAAPTRTTADPPAATSPTPIATSPPCASKQPSWRASSATSSPHHPATNASPSSTPPTGCSPVRHRAPPAISPPSNSRSKPTSNTGSSRRNTPTSATSTPQGTPPSHHSERLIRLRNDPRSANATTVVWHTSD
ncbi:hypothetical protein HUW46_06742 [Amycolatopsis sp. CA-230715]|nr:hypothetical protein HUW46_06742 [Amycolatopsis sp. CA-230715]